MLRPFTTALLVIAHDWKQPKCPIGTGRINCSTPAVEFHEAVEGSEEALCTTAMEEQHVHC